MESELPSLDVARLCRATFFATVAAASIGAGDALAQSDSIRQLASELQICETPNPQQPSSAFNIAQSTVVNGDYSVAYSCKNTCANWADCQVAAYSGGSPLLEGSEAKQSVAFVVDGMGGHLAYTTRQGGDQTVLLHTGTGGTGYMTSLSRQIENASNAKVVMVRWQSGFSNWGWFTRTSAPATRVPNVTRRIASLIAWIHENLAGSAGFGTVGCSMGTQATLGAVYYHSSVDSVVDYQLMVGGPGLWDINSGCGRRTYATGYCDLDATVSCSADADCASLSTRSRCSKPGPIPLAWLYEQVVNHVHATRACNVSGSATGTIAAFDESGFAFVAGDWDFDHPIDFQMDLWGSDGDHAWAMADAMRVFNSITSAAGHPKRWNTTADSNHCAAIGNGRALQLLVDGMGLGNTPVTPPPPSPPPPPPPPPPPNLPPQVVEAIADLFLDPDETATVELGGRFQDEGALTYSAELSAPGVASVQVAGDTLSVRGHAPGVVTITVVATDVGGLNARLRFDVSVGWLLSFASSSIVVREAASARLTLTLNRPAEFAFELSWRTGPDANAATADADAADVVQQQGTATIAAGESEATIEIPVADDQTIEPAREYLALTLLPPPSGAPLALLASSALIEIQEGVCDRTPAVRDALRGAGPCWAPTPEDLSATTELNLGNRQLTTLRSRDLLGLSRLRVLRLQGNGLSSLPAALFEGIGGLREADLRDNPGAPFALQMRLVRTDATEPWAAGPAEVATQVATGAPFPMLAQLAIEEAEGASATEAVSVSAGSVAAPSMRIAPAGPLGVRLTFSRPPAVPSTTCGNAQSGRYPCFRGLEAQAGPPLVLFKRPPMALGVPSDVTLAANGERMVLPLTQLFDASEALSFEAVSDNPELVVASVKDGNLVLDANAGGTDGTATVVVTATDWAGQATTARLELTLEFVPRGFLRSWRLLIPSTP